MSESDEPQHLTSRPTDRVPSPPKLRNPGTALLIALIGALSIVVVVLLVVVLGAGSDPAPSAAPTSPAAKTASVAQYAGIMNSSIKSVTETWDGFEKNLCVVKEDPSDLSCSLAPMTLDLQLQTMVLNLKSANTPRSTAYIGAPPAEISQLVQDTQLQAEKITGLIPDSGTPTGAVKTKIWSEMNAMMRILDRWEPYI